MVINISVSAFGDAVRKLGCDNTEANVPFVSFTFEFQLGASH